MELRHLRLVETVANEGSLAKAVDKLSVSPSALSHQLKEIETEIGVRLFDRISKKLVITDAGRIVLRSAKRVLRELELAEHDLMVMRDGQVGELNITSECYTCYHWLPGVMKSFSRDFPGVDIKIHPDLVDRSISALLGGQVDGVITSEWTDNPMIAYHQLFRDEMVAVVANGHPWEEKPYVEAEDFANENLIIYGKPLDSVYVFRQVLIPNNISPKKVMEVRLTEAQLEMVKAGYGVKTIARWAIEPYLKTHPITAIPITEKGLSRTWYFATLKKEPQPLYYKCFIKSLIRQMREGD